MEALNYRRIFFVLASYFSIILGGYRTFIVPIQNQFNKARNNLHQLHQQWRDLENHIFNKKSRQKITPKKQNTNHSDLSIVNIITNINRFSSQHALILTSIESSLVTSSPNLLNSQLKISCKGLYTALIGLLNLIITSVEPLTIEKIHLDKIHHNFLLMTLTIKIYHNQNSLSNLELSADQIITNHIIFSDFTSAKPNLALWEIYELSLLGILKKNDSTYGIVVDPLKNIHRVQLNDPIGVDAKIVSHIDKCRITVTNSDHQIINRQCL